MPMMFSTELDDYRFVPDDEVDARLRTGQWGFDGDTNVHVQLGDGTYTQRPASELGAVYSNGGAYDPVSARVARNEKKEWEGKGALAATAGVFRGLTFGLSDAGLAALPGIDEEDLRNLEEYNKAESMTGELAGMIVPAFFTGGASAAVSGSSIAARAALASGKAMRGVAKYTPAGVTAKVGQKVTGRVMGAIPEGASLTQKAMRTGAALGVGGGVEAGIYGGHQFVGDMLVDEEALGRPETTADELLSTVGYGIGGGAVLGAGAPALAKGFQKIGETVTDNFVTQTLGKGWDWLTTKLHDMDYDAWRKAQTDDDYLFFATSGKKRSELEDAVVNQTADVTDNILDTFEDLNAAAYGPEKRRKLAEIVEPENGEVAASTAIDLLRNIKNASTELTKKGRAQEYDLPGINEIKDASTHYLAKLKERIGKRGEQIDQAEVAMEGFMPTSAVDAVLEPAPLKDPDKLAADVFIMMDEFKKHLGGRWAKYSRKSFETLTPAQRNSSNEAGGTYATVAEFLQDPKMWGKPAADLQREVNTAFSRVQNAFQHPQGFRSRFTVPVAAESGAKKQVASSKSKLKTFVRGFGETRNADRERIFNEFTDRFRAYVNSVEKHYGVAGKRGQDVVRQIDEAHKSWADYGAKMDVFNDIKHVVQNKSEFYMSDLAVGGATAIYNPVALPLAVAAKSMMAPGTVLRKQAAVARIKASVNGRLHEAVDRVAEGMRTGTTGNWEMGLATGGRRIFALTAHEMGKNDKPSKQPDFRADATNAIEAVRHLSTPERTAKLVTDQTKQYEGYPKIQAAMAKKIGMMVSYANSAIPPTASTYVDPITGEQTMRASDADLRKFVGVLDMIEDPIGTLADGMNQNTLTQAQIQAVQTLYPELFNNFVFGIQKQLSESKKPVAYSKRIQLSHLTGMPMTPYMERGFMAAMQAVHGHQPTGSQQPRGYTGALRKVPEREKLPLQAAYES